jgi:L-ascorbate metabolism protein UlaG (beta-lactamase superfamily)
MSLQIQWINHASFRLEAEDAVVYVDPWKISSPRGDADVVFVSHAHFDHFNPEDVAAVSGTSLLAVGPADVVEQIPGGRVLKPGERADLGGVVIEGVRAYNVDKDFHPRSNDWLGAVIALGGVRVYYAGDTDCIPEMRQLASVDLALLPVGGTYTMNATEAAEACGTIGPRMSVPYHWGDIVGSEADARAFVDAASCCESHLLRPGDVISL